MNNVELCLQQRLVTEIPSFPAPKGDQPVYLREVAISHFCLSPLSISLSCLLVGC